MCSSHIVLCTCLSAAEYFLMSDLLWSVVAESDHTSHDCIAVGILSHGTHSGQVYGVDGDLVDVAVLLAPLKHCASLAGKPKIIVIEV